MAENRAIVIVANEVGPVGGMERQLTELICGLTRRGWRVTVVARSCELPPGTAVRYIRVPGPSRPFSFAYPWFMLMATLLTWRVRGDALVQATGAIVLNRVDVDAVHLCHHGLSRQADLLRYSRDRLSYRINARIARRISLLGERLCYRPGRVRRLACVSAGLADELGEAFPRLRDRITVVPNGVDPDRFQPVDRSRNGADPLTAAFVGGEWDGKGLAIVIRALGRAPRWRLHVAGSGDRRRFAALAADAGVSDRVHFLGRRDDPEAVYAEADAFVLPSVYETFSLVTYEAAASGLPMLATRVSGVEDILSDGVNGWFISRDAEDLAGRLSSLAEDAELRDAMGKAARAAALRHTWDHMVCAHEDLYESLLQDGRPA
jgi:glycosyltransferase involved in cell wall biosynthesis